MKDCKKIHPLLSFYIEGKLTPAERNQVEKHLGACETARAELEHLRHLLEGLRNLPEPEVPADLHGKIMAKLGQCPQPMAPRRHFWRPQIWGLAAAVVMVFVLFNQYPNWKDSWKVSKPEVPPASTETTHLPVPAPLSSQAPAAQKKAQVAEKAKVNLQTYAPVREKNEEVEGLSKDSSLAQNETKDMAGHSSQPAEMKANALAESESALLLKRSAKRAVQNDEMNAAGAAAPAPAAVAPLPPAPTPAVPALDQSLTSLTYSREQSVVTWNGNSGPSTLESQELVTDAETFQRVWQVPHPGEAPPAVDFTKDAVVILNAGEKPSAGYSIHVSRLEEKEDQLVIHYRVESPAPGAVAAAMITHPWVLQIIPKPSKPVIFVKDP